MSVRKRTDCAYFLPSIIALYLRSVWHPKFVFNLFVQFWLTLVCTRKMQIICWRVQQTFMFYANNNICFRCNLFWMSRHTKTQYYYCGTCCSGYCVSSKSFGSSFPPQSIRTRGRMREFPPSSYSDRRNLPPYKRYYSFLFITLYYYTL